MFSPSAPPTTPKPSAPQATTMRAWQYTTTTSGIEKNLTLNPSTPTPTLSPGSTHELLIRVLATSVNPSDYKFPEVLHGAVPSFLRSLVLRTTSTPCLDFCGVVAAASPKIDTFAIGDLVFGHLPPTCPYGASGEYILAPTKVCALLPKSGGITPIQAASIPCAGVTAYQCIAPHVKAGDKVFINGGGGGCGTFGIQIAKALGCFVTTTCSTGKVETLKNLGADEVIDYSTTNVIETMRSKGPVYTVCVDNVGAPAPDKESDIYRAAGDFLLPTTGRFIQVGMPVSMGAAKTLGSRILTPGFMGGGKSKLVVFMLDSTKTQDLETMARWVVEGKVKPVIEEVFAFEDLVTAFEKVKTGRTVGKLVVRVAMDLE